LTNQSFDRWLKTIQLKNLPLKRGEGGQLRTKLSSRRLTSVGLELNSERVVLKLSKGLFFKEL